MTNFNVPNMRQHWLDLAEAWERDANNEHHLPAWREQAKQHAATCRANADACKN